MMRLGVVCGLVSMGLASDHLIVDSTCALQVKMAVNKSDSKVESGWASNPNGGWSMTGGQLDKLWELEKTVPIMEAQASQACQESDMHPNASALHSANWELQSQQWEKRSLEHQQYSLHDEARLILERLKEGKGLIDAAKHNHTLCIKDFNAAKGSMIREKRREERLAMKAKCTKLKEEREVLKKAQSTQAGLLRAARTEATRLHASLQFRIDNITKNVLPPLQASVADLQASVADLQARCSELREVARSAQGRKYRLEELYYKWKECYYYGNDALC